MARSAWLCIALAGCGEQRVAVDARVSAAGSTGQVRDGVDAAVPVDSSGAPRPARADGGEADTSNPPGATPPAADGGSSGASAASAAMTPMDPPVAGAPAPAPGGATSPPADAGAVDAATQDAGNASGPAALGPDCDVDLTDPKFYSLKGSVRLEIADDLPWNGLIDESKPFPGVLTTFKGGIDLGNQPLD